MAALKSLSRVSRYCHRAGLHERCKQEALVWRTTQMCSGGFQAIGEMISHPVFDKFATKSPDMKKHCFAEEAGAVDILGGRL